MTTSKRRLGAAGVALAWAVGWAVAVVVNAGQAEAAGTEYTDWTTAGSSGAFTAATSLAAVGFPAASVTSDSAAVSAPSTAFLRANTPFGIAFGTSQGSPYLNVATAPGATPSTTTITFASPTPASGWGIAFSDIDADSLRIEATGPGGALTTMQLGHQGTFNFCDFGTPRPSSCSGAETDVPTWDAGTSTLVGNIADTTGATGWFRPTAPITSLTLTFTRLSVTGGPIFQTWIATETTTISGEVTLQAGGAAPAGTGLTLRDADGNDVATTSTAADGSYSFPSAAPRDYRVVVDEPAGLEAVGSDTAVADTTAGDQTDVDFVLRPVATTPPTTPPTTSPPTTAPTTAPPSEPATEPTDDATTDAPDVGDDDGGSGDGVLPDAGGSHAAWLFLGLGLTAVGAAVLRVTRKRR